MLRSSLQLPGRSAKALSQTSQGVRRFGISVRDQGDMQDSSVSSLVVKVHAGARYSPRDGVSHLLSRFAFQNTNAKSSLRLVRESELLGGQLEAHACREFITLRATFLKEQLPYYVETLGNVLYKTSFRPHELHESVLPAAAYDLAVYENDPINKANDLLYEITFRKGLGNPLMYDGVEPVSLEDIKEFANKVYTRDNINIVATNVNENDLKRFVNDSLINTLPHGKSLEPDGPPKTFTARETRLRASIGGSPGQSVVGIAIPVNKKQDFATYEVLANHLNASDKHNMNLQLNNNLSSKMHIFNNGSHGLFKLLLKGTNPTLVAEEFKTVIKSLKDGIDISNAKEITKLSLSRKGQTELLSTLNFGPIKNFKLNATSFNYVAVGDVSKLPYLDEL